MSANDVWTYELAVPWGTQDNPEWQARSIIINSNQRLRAIEAKLDAQNATITALAKALGERDAAVDVDALITRIRSEIAQVQVRLDAGA